MCGFAKTLARRTRQSKRGSSSAYAASGQVVLLSVGAGKIIAEVYGSERYSAVLTGSGRRTGGFCDCPAYDDAGFCKHLVATALKVNDMLAQGAGTDRLCEDIEAHIAALSKRELVNYMMSFAQTDTALFRRLAYDAELELRDEWG